MCWSLYVSRALHTETCTNQSWWHAVWPILVREPTRNLREQRNKVERGFGTNKVEWTWKVEVINKIVALGEACMAVFWPTSGFEGTILDSSRPNNYNERQKKKKASEVLCFKCTYVWEYTAVRMETKKRNVVLANIPSAVRMMWHAGQGDCDTVDFLSPISDSPRGEVPDLLPTWSKQHKVRNAAKPLSALCRLWTDDGFWRRTPLRVHKN